MEQFKTSLVRSGKLKVNKHLLSNIDEIIDMIRLKFDGVVLIDGMEGSGKSELGKQVCLISNNTFSDKDVFYTVDQFEEWVENSNPGSAGLWDEFVLAGLSTDALTKMQNVLIKKFTMMRKKGLIVVLVIPYIFMLRKYFAVARTRCLIHVYCKGKKRGYFKFYNYKEKQFIYNYGYKTWLYSPKMNASFQGMFSAWADDYLNVEAIENKKDEAMKLESEDKKSRELKQLENLCYHVSKDKNGSLKSWIKQNLSFGYDTFLKHSKSEKSRVELL